MTTRVVVTGLGALTSVGNSAASTWEAVCNAVSGYRALDQTVYPGGIGAVVADFVDDPILLKALSKNAFENMDLNTRFGVKVGLDALRDANVAFAEGLGERAGVIFGSGSGGYGLIAAHYLGLRKKSFMGPRFITNILPDAISGYLALLTGATGDNYSVVSACATGAGNIGAGYETIKRGDADLMLVGATEASINPLLFNALIDLHEGVTYDPDVDPRTACKPFDLHRDGFVVGEGAGCLVLESLEHAEQRSARIYCELGGVGSSNDAYNMVASEPNGRGPTLSITKAMVKAGIPREAIGYVNAHGTGTQMNDKVETAALKAYFGDHARRLAVSSTKSMLGHLMGAAGAVEAVVTVLALYHGILPPTINYETPDPACDLDYVPNEARKVSGLRAALSTSIGLGGHNAALVFKAI